MRKGWLLAATGLALVAGQPAPAQVGGAGFSPLALGCPPDTIHAGLAPPQGQEEWCQRADGTRHGPARLWHRLMPRVLAEGEYRDGQRHGRWVFWDVLGRSWAEGEYKNGRREGPWTLPSLASPRLPLATSVGH
jgi:hypothetical protein